MTEMLTMTFFSLEDMLKDFFRMSLELVNWSTSLGMSSGRNLFKESQKPASFTLPTLSLLKSFKTDPRLQTDKVCR